jgi:hypothetical protein
MDDLIMFYEKVMYGLEEALGEFNAALWDLGMTSE